VLFVDTLLLDKDAQEGNSFACRKHHSHIVEGVLFLAASRATFGLSPTNPTSLALFLKASKQFLNPDSA
jgi:hypothetical protein